MYLSKRQNAASTGNNTMKTLIPNMIDKANYSIVVISKEFGRVMRFDKSDLARHNRDNEYLAEDVRLAFEFGDVSEFDNKFVDVNLIR